MKKLRIGVFGAGRGKVMIQELLDREDACVTAICDKHVPTLDKAREYAAEKGTQVAFYEDFEEFFKEDMDAVVMANYAHEHAKYAIRLLKSGRHIMSEVLACATIKEAVELIEAVEESGKLYVYAENYCYFRTTFEMRKRYQAGEFGEFMYGEGEYIHDCSSIWPSITYGERDHWRNIDYSTFYCTHSLGPILFATGLRPVSVQGAETPLMDFMRDLGSRCGTAGIEIVKLENGGVVKSLHGGFKRQHGTYYSLFGSKGSAETDRYDKDVLHVYHETTGNCVGEGEAIVPDFAIDIGEKAAGHNGSDFFTTHYFVRAIHGDEDARAAMIDVYTAVDMTLPGIQAFRSIVSGGQAMEIPNLRLKSERDRWRNDTFCSFKEAAGTMHVDAMFAQKDRSPTPDSVYEEVRRKYLAGEPG